MAVALNYVVPGVGCSDVIDCLETVRKSVLPRRYAWQRVRESKLRTSIERAYTFPRMRFSVADSLLSFRHAQPASQDRARIVFALALFYEPYLFTCPQL